MQEAGWAVWARVRTFSCVLPHVDLQLVIPGEADAADLTGKRASHQYGSSCVEAVCLPHGLSCDRPGTLGASVNGVYAPACLGHPGPVPGRPGAANLGKPSGQDRWGPHLSPAPLVIARAHCSVLAHRLGDIPALPPLPHLQRLHSSGAPRQVRRHLREDYSCLQAHCPHCCPLYQPSLLLRRPRDG